jgi:hypothetical protein
MFLKTQRGSFREPVADDLCDLLDGAATEPQDDDHEAPNTFEISRFCCQSSTEAQNQVPHDDISPMKMASDQHTMARGAAVHHRPSSARFC